MFNCVTGVWQAVQDTWNSDRRNTPYQFVNAWRSIIRDQMQNSATQAEAWVNSVLAHMRLQFADVNTPEGHMVQEIIATFNNAVLDGIFEIPLHGW